MNELNHYKVILDFLGTTHDDVSISYPTTNKTTVVKTAMSPFSPKIHEGVPPETTLFSLFQYQLNKINPNLLQEAIRLDSKINNIILDSLLQKLTNSTKKPPLELETIINPEKKAPIKSAKATKESRVLPLDFIKNRLHPVKKFGLVLGIEMTSVDGTSSQYAEIGPTYQIMADAVSSFSRNHLDKTNFQEIAEAFDFSNTACAFRLSQTTRNPESSQELYARIQSGKLTTIPVSCKGHIMGLAYIPTSPGSSSGYLIYTNRGTGAHGNYGTKIFHMDDSSQITAPFIHHMLCGLDDETPPETIWSEIAAITHQNPPIYQIHQSQQKRDNCSIANPRSNIQGILLCQKAIMAGGFNQLSGDDIESVKNEYKLFTHTMRLEFVDELANELVNNPSDHDLKTLVMKYLEQHPVTDYYFREQLRDALDQAIKHAPITQNQSILSAFIDKADYSKNNIDKNTDRTIFNLFNKPRTCIDIDDLKKISSPLAPV